MATKKGVTPAHIRRMADARHAATELRPAGSLPNPARWVADVARKHTPKEIHRLAAEERLIASIKKDPNNIAVVELEDLTPFADTPWLSPFVMIDNETGSEPYEYTRIILIDGGFTLRNRVGYLQYVTIQRQDGTLTELALWPGTKVAWRVEERVDNDA